MQSLDSSFATNAAASPAGAESVSTLVILPGLDGTDVFSRPFVANLPATLNTRVLCYPPAGPHRYEELLSVVQAAVSDLPDFYLLGSSFGGPLAIMVAAAEPARVRGLILSATFARVPLPRLAPFRFALSGPLFWTLRAARRIPIWLKHPDDPLRKAKAETWSRVSAHCLAARARSALGVDARDALRRCTVPVLNVTFADDRTIPVAVSDEIAALCPRVRDVRLPGGHLAMFSEPASLAATVSAFIEELELPLRTA